MGKESLKLPRKGREPKQPGDHSDDRNTSKKKGKEKSPVENQAELVESDSKQHKEKQPDSDCLPAKAKDRLKKRRRTRDAVPGTSDISRKPETIGAYEEAQDDDEDGGMDTIHQQIEGVQTSEVKEPGASLAEGMKQTKKRKRSDIDNVTGRTSGEQHLKKEKHNMVFPDPTKDESLTDHNRRALSYAYDRFHNPSSWKFNKARQNWLIRNIWSEQAIPEKYVPLLQRYLIDIKGGIRQRLVDLCNSKTQTQSPGEDTSNKDVLSDEGSQMVNATVSRAHLLLAALSQTC